MIRVTIRRNNGKFASLEVKGHANADVSGKDIVCAGVSAVFVGGLNSLSNPDNYRLLAEEGYGLIEAVKPESEHDQIVIETIIVQLKSIAETEGNFVSIKEK